MNRRVITLTAALAVASAASALPLGLRLATQSVAKSTPVKDPLLMTEAEAYKYYAPDFAMQIDTSIAKIDEIWFSICNRGSGDENATVDWGDGTIESFSDVSYYGNWIGHAYPNRGSYVIRISNGKYAISISNDSYKRSVRRVLRWCDAGMVPSYSLGDSLVSLADGRLARWPEAATDLSGVYYACENLDAIELPAWPKNLANAKETYTACCKLSCNIPPWPVTLTNANSTFFCCYSLKGAWTDDPALLMPSGVIDYTECVLGASDDIRRLFYQSWGGTIADP